VCFPFLSIALRLVWISLFRLLTLGRLVSPTAFPFRKQKSTAFSIPVCGDNLMLRFICPGASFHRIGRSGLRLGWFLLFHGPFYTPSHKTAQNYSFFLNLANFLAKIVQKFCFLCHFTQLRAHFSLFCANSALSANR